ncbi:NACHT domain-containing protein [Paenibacillus glycanilyticus]|uniref:NACHT domain-containing protein n=1 Tax=Paenibacillus glycanilyticus TaxID=126569 RepID=A0ABQ6G978_9BACL|nr:hypothetical protein [Paenibacillus glycanilyticus]GLX67468.1 hypothetical protein MU1_18130 [Paenibacillus glycanilyticus]
MTKYNLGALGHENFEELSQSLVQNVIGHGIKVYGMGSDGAREATYFGSATYPSTSDNWDGYWIFQSKFHNVIQIGQKEARRLLYSELEDELHKITDIYHHQCDNYILITNVSLSPVYQKGLKDRIDTNLIPKFNHKVKNIHVWGAEEVCAFLDSFPGIRQSYSHLLVSGDVIARLLGFVSKTENEIDELVRLYSQYCYLQESAAALDDAGDTEDTKVPLQKVFIDVDVIPAKLSQEELSLDSIPRWLKQSVNDENRVSALSYIVDDSVKRVVFVGGPGQGKSTLGQYMSQIYRARLLGKMNEFSEDTNLLEQCIPRIPFRIILKDLAHWFNLNTQNSNLFEYMATEMTIGVGKKVTCENVHEILRNNAVLLILDGLDEVPEKTVRHKVMVAITTFIQQVQTVYNCDLKIISSTRPQGYSEEFDPKHFLHLKLDKLSVDKARIYAQKWVENRETNIMYKRSQKILDVLNICLEDKIVSDLTKTPLQVTILLVIIRAGSTPPKQREELYQKYMDTIYTREQNKSPHLLPTDKNLIYGLHKYIAYLLHSKMTENNSNALMDLKDFRSSVYDYLVHNNPYINEEELIDKVKQIMIESNDRLVLIESPQAGKIGYSLTVMREFFTACHLVDTAKDSNERILRFKATARTSHWRNVALFFAGRIGRTLPGEAPGLIDICSEIDSENEDKYLKRGAQLVLDILDDRALREPFQEISALKEAILLIDYDTPVTAAYIYNKISYIPLATIQKVTEGFFINRFDSIVSSKLKKYAELYEMLFGFDERLNQVILILLKEKNEDDLKFGIYLCIKYNLLNKPLLDAIDYYLTSKDKMFSLVITTHNYWKNLIDMSFTSDHDLSESFISFMFYFIEEIIDISHNEDETVIELCNYLKARTECEWTTEIYGPYFLFNLIHSNSSEQKSLPCISNPKIKETITNNKNKIETYLKEANSDNNIIVYTREIFKYLLDTINYNNFDELYRNATSYLPILKILVTESTRDNDQLYRLYSNYEEYVSDLELLNELLSKKTDISNHDAKLSQWINFGCPESLEHYLDNKVINEIKLWFRSRNISIGVLGVQHYYMNRFNDLNLSRMFSDGLDICMHQKNFSLKYFSFPRYNRGKNDENISDLILVIKRQFKELLYNYDDYSQENRTKIQFIIQVYFNYLIETDEFDVEIIKPLYDHLLNTYTIEGYLHLFLSPILTSKMISLLESDSTEVHSLAALLLTTRSKLFRDEQKYEEHISDSFFSFINEDSQFRSEFIGGLSASYINWEKYSKKIYSSIVSDINNKNLWLEVVQRAGYRTSNKKNIRDLVFLLIEDGYHLSELYERLTEIIDVAFIDELALNLPLAKRRMSDIY